MYWLRYCAIRGLCWSASLSVCVCVCLFVCTCVFSYHRLCLVVLFASLLESALFALLCFVSAGLSVSVFLCLSICLSVFLLARDRQPINDPYCQAVFLWLCLSAGQRSLWTAVTRGQLSLTVVNQVGYRLVCLFVGLSACVCLCV